MARTRGIVGLVMVAMLSLLASPALAQDPYPPPPPGGGGSSEAEVSAEVRCSDGTRVVAVSGEGFRSNSTVSIEIRAQGSAAGDGPLAGSTEPVDAEGKFDARYDLPDSYDQDKVRLRVRGRDAEDRPVTESRVLQVPDCEGSGVQGQEQEREPGPGDDGQAGDDEGADDTADVLGRDQEQDLGAPAVDRDADGSLAVTGRNIWLLTALALVLATLGTVLARFRRDRATGAS